MNSIVYLQTEIGRIAIEENGAAVTNVYFEKEEIISQATVRETELLKEAERQLNRYFAGKQKEFSIPIAAAGTKFQQRVWKSLCSIPYGETRSYKEIAVLAGSPKAFRAVGMANNRNPVPIFIPCHRVIGANGKLIGYRGGLDVKEKLLNLENSYINQF
jgi:methylated-DNA-[protein]-cysteine S-methyltransferase